MTIHRLIVVAALSAAVLGMSGVALAHPSTAPDNATTVPPDMGVKPAMRGASAPLPSPEDLKPRMRPELDPRMKPEELKPALRPGMRPEMSPGMQPNSQKPLKTDANTQRGGSPAN
ncbi:hypothetical protein [Polaromonas sp.]|uniref:hypothetical protein n=1 Tax=Polaromonas sp. TaxID=1869339 RepID=UPI003561DAC4